MFKTKIKIKSQKLKIFNIFLVISLITNFLLPYKIYAVDDLSDPEIIKLNEQVEEKKIQIEELNRQKNIYQQNINFKQKEAVNLRNQVEILDNEIAKIALEIQTTEIDIEKTNLEIKEYQNKILIKEREIGDSKEKLAEVIRQLYKNKRQDSFLEIFILNDSLGSFFAQINKLENVQEELKNGVDELKALKQELELQKSDLEKKNLELNQLKAKLNTDKEKMENERRTKEVIFIQTKGEELKFQSLYNQLIQEQQQINEEIQDLEIQTRKKLLELQGLITNEAGLIWPVNSRIITATFHDPEYPFRYIFEHPGVDIGSTPQGTEVRAALSGYVAIAKNGGLYGYSYVMIVHPNGLSTVYGHLSQIITNVDTYIVQGEVIGLSGGMPGTPGAGYLSTGPHLHFEVRLNGIPVDPMLYLP